MATKIKEKPLSLAIQAAKIKKRFPQSQILKSPDQIIWKGSLTPSWWGDIYDIKILYKTGGHPHVYVINKILQLYPGKKSLPHVYCNNKQWLCLYYKKANEWKSTMFIADTVIPWTSEWLYHYEIWAGSGKWNGKGIHGKSKPYVSAE